MGQSSGFGHRLEQSEEARVRDDHAGHRALWIGQHSPQRRQVGGAGRRACGDERYLVGHQVGSAEVRAQRLAIVRMDAAAHQHTLAASGPAGHQSPFGCGRGPVVVRGRNHVHARELAHHRLVFVDGLERALADLGLVGRVGGVELAAQEELVDDRGDEVAIGAGAEEAHQIDPIAGGQPGQPVRQLGFGFGRRELQLRGAQR